MLVFFCLSGENRKGFLSKAAALVVFDTGKDKKICPHYIFSRRKQDPQDTQPMGTLPSKISTGFSPDETGGQTAKNASLSCSDVAHVNRTKRRHTKRKKSGKSRKSTFYDDQKAIAPLATDRKQKTRESTTSQSNATGLAFSEVSRDKISAYVADILKDPSQNIWMVPDRVEGALYESAIQIAVGAIAHVLESARVELLGHEIRFVLSPIRNDSSSKNSQSSTSPMVT